VRLAVSEERRTRIASANIRSRRPSCNRRFRQRRIPLPTSVDDAAASSRGEPAPRRSECYCATKAVILSFTLTV
jgi:hypothetical protein